LRSCGRQYARPHIHRPRLLWPADQLLAAAIFGKTLKETASYDVVRRSILTEDCCSEVRPENSARTFSNPAEIVRKAVNDGLIQKRHRLLEIGSGCLRNAAYLLNYGVQVTARDLPGVIRRYQKRYDRFVKNGGKLLPFGSRIPGTFDVVLSTFTLETICRRAERLEMLQELIESLNRGGRMVLAVRGPRDVKTAAAKGQRCGDGYITPQKTFVKPFTVKELTSLLSRRGLSILKIYSGKKQNEPKIIEIVAEML